MSSQQAFLDQILVLLALLVPLSTQAQTLQAWQNNGASSEYLRADAIASALGSDQTFTVEFWHRTVFGGPVSGRGGIFSIHSSTGSNKYILFNGSSTASYTGFPQMLTGLSSTDVGTTDLSTEVYAHMALVFDGTDVKLYIDGVLDAQVSQDVTLAATDQWSFGQEYDGGATSDFTSFQMDEMRVWNRPLTAVEVDLAACEALSNDNALLVASYEFNGNLTDATGNGNTLIAENLFGGYATSIIPDCPQGTKLDTDNDNDRFDFSAVADDLAGGTDFTIGTWFKANKASQNESIEAILAVNGQIGGVDNYAVFTINNTSGFGTLRAGTSTSGSFDVGDNQWHYLTLSGDGTEIKAYIDGCLYTTADAPPGLFDAGFRYTLGAEWDGSTVGNTSEAQFEDLSVFSRVLDGFENQDLACNALSLSDPDYVAYYNFDEGIGGAINDITGNGNDATIVLPDANGQALRIDDYASCNIPSSESVVTSSADSGPGSLRDVIAGAGGCGSSIITF